MTISEKRSAAARANGARSRGPITPEGKARSSRNATRHGLLSQLILLPGESPDAFDITYQGYVARFQPVDEVELAYVEEMVVAHWKLRRAMSAETNMFEAEMKTRHNGSITTAFSDLSDTPKLNNITRYQTRFHNMHSRALRDLINLRKAVPSTARPPAVWPMPADALVPNEPKTPCVCNKSVEPEPNQEPNREPIPNPARETTHAPALPAAPAPCQVSPDPTHHVTPPASNLPERVI